MTDKLVNVIEVRCPRHGPKEGLFLKGQLYNFPIPMMLKTIERTTPLCFECKSVGVRRRCTVIMEPLGAIGE